MTFKNTLEENRGRIQIIYRNTNVLSFDYSNNGACHTT